jgi:hypothetical protein
MNRILFFSSLLLIFGLFLGNPVLADDTIGIYWDTEFTENSLLTATYPSIHTGYLVLKDPTATLGVIDWECCVGIEGPAIFLSWVLEGHTLNLDSPPCFQVGISPDPLPVGNTVLLATFMTMVSEEAPVAFSVEPLVVPGQMSYSSADDPSDRLPMTSVTGNPEVAWINDDVPLLEIDRDHVLFDDTIVGYPKIGIVTVSNLGFVDVVIEAAFSEPGGVFSLTGPGNPVNIPARSSIGLEVTFNPPGGDYYTCTMNLGDLLPEVFLEGRGLSGILSWEIDPVLDFGLVEIGRFKWGYVTIVNTGEVPFPVDLSLPGTCLGFEFTWGPFQTTLGPSDTLKIQITFEPPAERPYSCTLSLGEILPDVTLMGTGSYSVPSWEAPTEFSMGPVGLGLYVEKAFQIRNTGSIPILINATLPDTCGEFSIELGAGITELVPGTYMYVRLRFEPDELGISTCTLDLGDVVPPVFITGECREPVLLWESPAQHDFGEVALGNDIVTSFYLWNIGDIPFLIDVVLPGTCPEFEVTQGEGPRILDPGRPHRVYVRFTPSVLDSATCLLDMGEVVPPVLLTGVGTEPDPGWTITGPDFDPTGVGEIDAAYVYIHNTGNITFIVSPSINYPCSHFVLKSGATSVPPGGYRSLKVEFRPTLPGSLSCVLDLGDLLPDVPLVGEAFPRPEGWEITPLSVDFPSTFVGDWRYTVIDFHNTGGTTLSIDARLEPEIPNISIDTGGGPFEVLPGWTHSFSVQYHPVTAGTDSTTVLLGASYPPIPVTGLAVDKTYGCLVQPDTLDFGSLQLGQTAILPFSITNTGNQPLEVTPLLDSPHFPMNYGERTLDPGETFNGAVTFFPLAPGFHEALVDLGNGLCRDIVCQGTALTDFQDGENLVGMFFDLEFSALTFRTTATPEIVTGYLVFSNPSTSTGVAAWECAYDLAGNGQYLGWQLEGQAINVGDYNNLIVGIGGPPLPFGPKILLATFQILVPSPSEILELSLRPTQFPSIPGQMVWAPGDPPGVLLPMRPTTGQETVAWINKDVVSAGSDIPLATGLWNNIPNPFNPSTRINFALGKPTNVRITIYDVTGRSIMTLVDGFLEAGPHSRVWRGRDEAGRQAPSGSYFVKLVTDKRVDSQKILLLK